MYNRHDLYKINIPLGLLRRCRSERHRWDLLVFAIIVKMRWESGAMHSPTVKKLMKLLRCGRDKARRILSQAKSDRTLFRYDAERDILTARRWIRKYRIVSISPDSGNRSPKGKVPPRSLYCFKLDRKAVSGMSHFQLARYLRDRLMTHAIEQKQRKDDFIKEDSIYSTRADRSTALSCRRLGRIAGYSKSTVSRHIRKLRGLGKNALPGGDVVLDCKVHPFIPMYDIRSGLVVNDAPELQDRRPFVCGRFLGVRDANEDRVREGKQDVTAPAMNVIFNHRGRLRRNISGKDLSLGHYSL